MRWNRCRGVAGCARDARVEGEAHVPGALVPSLHRAARVEDAVHEFLEPRLRQRGWRDTIIPYTGYGTPSWVRVMARLLLRKPEQRPERVHAVRGWRSFATLPVTDEVVVIDVGDRQHEARTDRGGYIDVVVEASFEPGWRSVRLHREGAEPVEAPVRVLAPDMRFGVVSDIDDTVMVTALPRPLLAAWNTFVLDEHARSPVPGMAVLYERLVTAHPDAPVFYLSTGAWNVAPDADPLPVAQPVPARPAAAHRLGSDDRSLVPQRAGAQAGRRSNGWPRSSRTSAGCSSATTGNTTRRSTADFVAVTPGERRRRGDPPALADAVGARRWPARPVDGSASSERHGRPWMCAPDGAGLARQLSETGLL